MTQSLKDRLRQILIRRLAQTGTVNHQVLDDLQALARLPDLANVETFVGFISRNLRESMAKKAATIALDAIVNIPDVIPALRDMLTSDCWQQRMTASLALAELNDVESRYKIADLLMRCDPAKTTAIAYLESLKALDWQPETDAEQFRVFFLEENWDGIVSMKQQAVPFIRDYITLEPQKRTDGNLSVHSLNKRLLEVATRIPTLEMLECLLESHRIADDNNLDGTTQAIEHAMVTVLLSIPDLEAVAGEAVSV